MPGSRCTHTQVGSIQSGPNSAPCVSSDDDDSDDSLMPRTTSHYFLFSNLDITPTSLTLLPTFGFNSKHYKRGYRPILECNKGNAEFFFFSFCRNVDTITYPFVCRQIERETGIDRIAREPRIHVVHPPSPLALRKGGWRWLIGSPASAGHSHRRVISKGFC